MSELQQYDIIQITAEMHAWYGCLLVVDEVKAWGVVAYLDTPQSNDGSKPIGRAFNRLANGMFEKVGTSVIVTADEAQP